MDYIYHGEVQLYQEDLDSFLDTANKLKVNGLIGSGNKENQAFKDEDIQNDKNDILPHERSTTKMMIWKISA